jgi:hypothetical protein
MVHMVTFEMNYSESEDSSAYYEFGGSNVTYLTGIIQKMLPELLDKVSDTIDNTL